MSAGADPFPNYTQVPDPLPQSAWRAARVASVAFLAGVVVLLVADPDAGLDLWWGLLVPLLPLVWFVAPGLWRNVCPLAAANQIPRVLGFRRNKISVHDAAYTPLYFANYADLPYEVYAKDFEEIMNDSDRTYEVMVKEIYYSGVYLVKNKYRYVRLGYIAFFAGLIVSTLIFFVENFI